MKQRKIDYIINSLVVIPCIAFIWAIGIKEFAVISLGVNITAGICYLPFLAYDKIVK